MTTKNAFLNNKEQFKKIFFFIPLYGFLKLSSLTAPLFLSNILSKKDYGEFEYAFSIGVILGVFLDFGFSGSYSFFVLKQNKLKFIHIFRSFIVFVVTSTITISSLLLYLKILNQVVFIAILIAVVWQFQMFTSSTLKTANKAFLAIITDSIFFLLINLTTFFLLFFKIDYDRNILISTLLLYIIVMLGFYFYKSITTLKYIYFSVSALKTIIFYSFPFLLNGFLMMFLVNISRILIEKYCGTIEVANYSFFFRISYLILSIYQVFNIFFFSKSYLMNSRNLDNYFFYVTLCATIVAYTLWFSIPLLNLPFTLLQDMTDNQYKLFFILCSYAIFWVISAFNEGVLGRESVLVESNYYNTGLIIIFLALVYIISHFTSITPNIIVTINYMVIFLVTQIQFYILERKKITFYKLHRFSIVHLFLSTSFYFFFL